MTARDLPWRTSHTGVRLIARVTPKSALDGVEAMNLMANMMREHIPSEARMHYVITSGGSAPNVVPDYARMLLLVRDVDREHVVATTEWVRQIAEGAALATLGGS